MSYVNILNAYHKYRMSNNERPGERSGEPEPHVGPLAKKYISKAGEIITSPREGAKIQDHVRSNDILHPFRVNNNPLSPERGYISDKHFPAKTDTEHPHLQASRRTHEVYKLLTQHLPEITQATPFLKKHGAPGVGHLDEEGNNHITLTEDHFPALKKKSMAGDDISKGILKKLVGHTVIVGPDEHARAGITHILPPGIEKILERSLAKRQRMSTASQGNDEEKPVFGPEADAKMQSANPFKEDSTPAENPAENPAEKPEATEENLPVAKLADTPKEDKPSKPENNDYISQLEAFKQEDADKAPWLKKVGQGLFAAKGVASKIMNSIYQKRLESFMRGQTHKYSSGMMRPSQPTAEQKYSQEYGEASGKMVAPTQRDPLLKNLATIASQKGGLKSYLMAWHQLEHLKTGKAPTLDSKQLEKLKEQYDAFTGKDKKQSSEGKSKGRRTQKDPNENKQVG